MCNACGFQCCAYDGFSGCGCDHCDEPDCWSDDRDEDAPDAEDWPEEDWPDAAGLNALQAQAPSQQTHRAASTMSATSLRFKYSLIEISRRGLSADAHRQGSLPRATRSRRAVSMAPPADGRRAP